MRKHLKKTIAIVLMLVMLMPLQALSVFALTIDELEQTYQGEDVVTDANLDEATLKEGSDRYGSWEKVSVADQDFTEARRLITTTQPNTDSDIQVEIPVHVAIEKDDALLASFYARTVSATHESGEANVMLILEKVGTWEKSIRELISTPSEWKQYLIPIKALLDMPADQSHVTLRFGYKPQVVEIADFKIVNYKKQIDFEDLPNTPIYYEGMEEDAPWRDEANARIEQYRKGDLEVVVKDSEGNPVEGADVRVDMSEHAFHFGTAVNSSYVLGTDAASETYRQKLIENFNSVVMENETKWPWWENDKTRAVKLYNWLGANGFDVRGHTLIWDGLTRMPGDINAIMNNEEEINTRIRDHFHEVAGYFQGRFYDWDVINEPTVNETIRSIYGDQVAADWFKLAKEADPNAKLYVNETQILGLDSPVIEQFSSFLQSLKDNDAPIDGVGIQAHFGSTPVSPMAFYNQLTHFTQYADEIAITEYDMNTPKEELQAQYLHDLLLATFSHPNVQSFMMWGFWDGAHWQNNAPLYRQDWSLKPSGEVWQELIYRTWWTNEQGVTDSQGVYTTRGFYGEYEITVDYNGVEQVHHMSLLKGQDNTFTITLGEESEEQEEFVPLPVPDQTSDITKPVWNYGSTFSASEVSPTSVTLRWPNAHDNIAVDHYLIYQDGDLLQQLPANMTSYDVTGLQQNLEYAFTIVAVDGQGNRSVASMEIPVTTKAGSDTTLPGWSKGSYLSLSNLQQISAVVSWPQAIDNVAATSYRIYVNGQAVAETEEQSYTITNLMPDTQYTVRVEVKDQTGNLSYGGPIIIFKTLGGADTTPPAWNDASLAVSDITADSLQLQWPAAQDARGVTAYRLFRDNQELTTLPAVTTAYRVSRLSENTSYSFRVEAVDQSGNWSDSGPQIAAVTAVAHDEISPTWPPTRVLTYSGLTDQQVSLEWTPAEDNNEVTEYLIYQDGTLVDTVTGNVNQYTITGLEASQRYTFRVEAGDAFENVSAAGPSVTIKTHAGLVRQQQTIYPSDDAFIQAPATYGGAGTNNNIGYLRYKNAAGVSGSDANKNTGNNRRIFLKFPLQAVTDNVYEATLNLYVFAVQTPNMDINMDLYAAGDSWDETTINWANRPEQEGKLASDIVRNQGYWKSFDVTDYTITEVNGDQQISFLLQDDAWLDQNVDIYSKEATGAGAAFRPYLSIGTEAAASDDEAPIWVAGTLSDSGIKPHGAVLTWSGATDNTGIMSYSIYQDNLLIATVGGDISSYEVTGLSPATAYQFRVEAQDAAQESTDGPSVNLLTAAADQVSPVWASDAELVAANVTRTEAQLQWTAAQDQYGVADYIVYVGNEQKAIVTETTYKLTGLLAGSTNDITIIARDKAGNESDGLTLIIHTRAADNQAPEWTSGSQLTATDINSYGLMLSWPEAADDTAIAKYRIYLGDAATVELADSIHNYYIQGLTADASYSIAVIALDAADNASARLELVAATLTEDTITPVWPTGSKITSALDDGNIILQWDEAIDNQSIKAYKIYKDHVLIATVTGDVTQYVTAGTAADLLAVYKVEAEDAIGNSTVFGPSTADVEVPLPTDTTAPVWPENRQLLASQVTQTSLKLSWSAALDQWGVTAYKIMMNGNVIAHVANTTYVVQGLTAGQTYQFKVEAADAAENWTVDGPELTVKTNNAVPGNGGATSPPEQQAAVIKVENGQVIIEVQAAAQERGKMQVSIDKQTLTDALNKAQAESNGERRVAIHVSTKANTNANAYTIELPAEYLTQDRKQYQFELQTDIATVTLPGNMLANNEAAKQQQRIAVTVAQLESTSSGSVTLGKSGMVLDLNVTSAGKPLLFDYDQAVVQVRAPYPLNATEKQTAEYISVWFIDEQGAAHLVRNGKYDLNTGEVEFEVSRFGTYAVSYAQKSFADIVTVPWAEQAIQVLASKGIIQGVSERSFAPNAFITRADFTKLLIDTLGIVAPVDQVFTDVNLDSYYYQHVAIAHHAGIVIGSGEQKFNPTALITRQDMIVMIYRALNYVEQTELAATSTAIAGFDDKDKIAAYALDAVAALVSNGLVKGEQNRLEPVRNTTRAEAAVLLYRLFHHVFQ